MPLIRGNAGGDKPIIRVALIPALPRPDEVAPLSLPSRLEMLECRALLDTGADGTSVCKSVAMAAKLTPYGKMQGWYRRTELPPHMGSPSRLFCRRERTAVRARRAAA